MSRAHLAPWGDELSSEESAAALAAAGVLVAAGGLSRQADTTSLAVSLEHRFMISPGEPVEWGISTWTDWLSPSFLGPARPLADAWRASVSALSTEHWPRLEVQATPRAFDVPWLVERLSLPSLQTRSVYVADSWLSQEAKWSWPMRLGILGEELSHHFRSSLIEDHWRGELFDLAEGSSELDQLDLLLVPGDADSGLQEVLRAPAPVEANCVIVLGRRNESWQVTRPLLEALAAQTEASGVAVVPTAPGDRAKWLHELVRTLAHDAPIDVALPEASHNIDAPVPLFLANRALAQASRVSVQAERVIEQVSAAVEPAPVDVPERLAEALSIDPGAAPSADVAARVRERIPELAYNEESGAATTVADFAKAAESILAPPPERNFRRILAHVYDVSDAQRPRPLDSAFRAGAPHKVEMWIGPWEVGVIAADQRFPEEALPPSTRSHRLTVVFTDLNRPDGTQVRTIRLPRVGRSTTCTFGLHVSAETQEVAARILVLYRNRVLQTASLRGPVLTDLSEVLPGTAISIEVGAILRPSIGDLSGRQPFDAALVFNELPDSRPAVTTVAGDRANIRVLGGVSDVATQIKNELTEAARSPDRYDSFDTASSLILLRTLANQGAALREALIQNQNVDDALVRGTRIQILAVKPEQVIPLELIYDRHAPSATAELCPNFAERVLDGDCSEDCPGGDETPSPHVCPLAFWCAKKVIERQATDERNLPADLALDLRLSTETTKGRDVLHGFTTALLAGSSKVDTLAGNPAESPLEKIRSTLASLTDNRAERVETWEDWRSQVTANHPSLMLVLPHTLQVLGVQGMEIGTNAQLAWTALTPDMIGTKESGAPPIVLLLGCDTAVPDVAFESFVLKFRTNGAAIVLGTLAAVLGRYAAPLAEDLVRALREAADAAPGLDVESDKATFGHVVRSARRRLMAKGQLMALTLSAYGDAQWRLAPAVQAGPGSGSGGPGGGGR
jgi:hypothetical protein